MHSRIPLLPRCFTEPSRLGHVVLELYHWGDVVLAPKCPTGLPDLPL